MKKRGNGEGSIFYRESLKKWVGAITIGVDGEGKQIKKTFLFKVQVIITQYGSLLKQVKFLQNMDLRL